MKKKTIFLSDIHMTTEQSYIEKADLEGKNFISRANLDMLADFLETYPENAKADTIVFLGDIFDHWLIPSGADPQPDTYLKKIADYEKNKRVIDIIKKISKQVTIVITQGNHDMLIGPQKKMNTLKFREIFPKEDFPNITFDADENSLSVYRENKLIAAHGHKFSIDCAPDPFTGKPGQLLPFGYFTTRHMADKELAHDPIPEIPECIFNSMKCRFAIMRNLKKTDLYKNPFPVIMNFLDEYGEQVEIIDRLTAFIKYVLNWNKYWGSDNFRLNPLLFIAETKNPILTGILPSLDALIKGCNTAVYGHTHQAAIYSLSTIQEILNNLQPDRTKRINLEDLYINSQKQHELLLTQKNREKLPSKLKKIEKTLLNHIKPQRLRLDFNNLPNAEDIKSVNEKNSSFVYANSGTWIGEVCSFVETEIDDNRRLVTLKKVTGDGTSYKVTDMADPVSVFC